MHGRRSRRNLSVCISARTVTGSASFFSFFRRDSPEPHHPKYWVGPGLHHSSNNHLQDYNNNDRVRIPLGHSALVPKQHTVANATVEEKQNTSGSSILPHCSLTFYTSEVFVKDKHFICHVIILLNINVLNFKMCPIQRTPYRYMFVI